MKTSFDFVDAIWKALEVSGIKSELSGGLYKHKRPFDSRQVDIVVNALPASAIQLQECLVNVNVHVPNLKLQIAGKEDITQPDNVRLNELSNLVIDALKDYESEDFYCEIQQQITFEEEELHEHYSNIRVQTFYINI